MAIFIIALTVVLLVLAVSIYVLLIKKNIRVAVFAIGVGVLLPLFLVTGNCVRDSHSDACAWGKARLPYYLAGSAITVAPLLYLLGTALVLLNDNRARKYKHRRKANTGQSVRFSTKSLTCIDVDGNTKSIRWQQIHEIRLSITSRELPAPNLTWMFSNQNQSRQLQISNEARGAKQMIAHIQRFPGYDHDSVRMAIASAEDVNFLIWMRN